LWSRSTAYLSGATGVAATDHVAPSFRNTGAEHGGALRRRGRSPRTAMCTPPRRSCHISLPRPAWSDVCQCCVPRQSRPALHVRPSTRAIRSEHIHLARLSLADTELSLGRAVAGSAARVMARNIGREERKADREVDRPGLRPDHVTTPAVLLGKTIQLLPTLDGESSAADGEQPLGPVAVQRYLAKASGDHLAEVRQAMDEMTSRCEPTGSRRDRQTKEHVQRDPSKVVGSLWRANTRWKPRAKEGVRWSSSALDGSLRWDLDRDAIANRRDATIQAWR